MEEKKAPKHKLKERTMEAAAWENPYGLHWKIQKRFYNKKTDKWENTTSFFLDDLYDIKKLCDQAIELSKEARLMKTTLNRAEDTEW